MPPSESPSSIHLDIPKSLPLEIFFRYISSKNSVCDLQQKKINILHFSSRNCLWEYCCKCCYYDFFSKNNSLSVTYFMDTPLGIFSGICSRRSFTNSTWNSSNSVFSNLKTPLFFFLGIYPEVTSLIKEFLHEFIQGFVLFFPIISDFIWKFRQALLTEFLQEFSDKSHWSSFTISFYQ